MGQRDPLPASGLHREEPQLPAGQRLVGGWGLPGAPAAVSAPPGSAPRAAGEGGPEEPLAAAPGAARCGGELLRPGPGATMVLLSGDGEQLAGERVCPAPAAAKELPSTEAESSPEQGAAGAAAEGLDEEEDEEDEEEEDCEEYEDFSELPDTCSIASDDSFYPPRGLEDDEEDRWSLEQGDRDSPEALTLFRACCTNNTIVLKALIRQGPEEEEVRETDRNRRVSIPCRDPAHPRALPRGAEPGGSAGSGVGWVTLLYLCFFFQFPPKCKLASHF